MIADPLANARISFLVTGDPQVTDAHDLNLLSADVDRLTELLVAAEFLVVLGDLTKSGTQQQLEGYRSVMAPIWDRTYFVFGGHDGLSEQPQRFGTERFEKIIGPAWRSWRSGGVHFLSLTTERPFLNQDQYDEQLKWLSDDLDRVPGDLPLVCFCHVPPDDVQYEILRRRHRVQCIFLGHWHTPHCDRIHDTWWLSPGTQRGRDLGAAARMVMTVHIAGNQTRTQLASLDLKPSAPAQPARWRRRVASFGQMIGSPVADGADRIYCPIAQFDAPEDDGGIACIDVHTGQSAWHSRWPGGVLGTPVLLDEHVAALTVNGQVICLHQRNGAVHWQHPLYPNSRSHDGGFINCRSRIYECKHGLLVLGSDRPLILLDARSGRLLRQYESPRATPVITAAPVPAGDDFVLATPREVRRIGIASGETIWKVATKNTRYCSPAAVADGRVFFSAPDFHALDLATGRIIWTRSMPLGAWIPTPPLVVGETVVSMGRQVVALGQASGDIRWSFDPFADHPALGSDPAVGGTFGCCLSEHELIFGCDNGKVYGIDARSGAYRWSINIGTPVKRPPVVVNSAIVAHDFSGMLSAFDKPFGAK